MIKFQDKIRGQTALEHEKQTSSDFVFSFY